MAEYIYDPAFYISVSGTDPTCYSSYCCCSHCWHDRLQKALSLFEIGMKFGTAVPQI